MAKTKKDYSKFSREKLIAEIHKLSEERQYGLIWEDKEENVVKQCQKELPVLEEVKNKEIITDSEKPVNLIIEGDNYHSLSVLNYTHAGKVDVIYIDPPYNTGSKDFIFNDRYVDKEDKYRHSKWLSFMEKRLRLAKELLKPNGVIFISIDDNELAQLKILLDHLFNNQTDVIIWRKSGDSRWGKMKNVTTFRKDHEYIIVGYRSSRVRFNKMLELPNFIGELSNPDNDPRGDWLSGSISRKETASNPSHPNYYTVISPSNKKFTRQWDIPQEEFKKLNKDKRIYWGSNNGNVPRVKIFANEKRFITPYSVFLTKGTTTEGKEELREIFNIKKGQEDVFQNPKPVSLIKTLIQLTTKRYSVIVDFFAGTGTTGQAVLEMNKEDNGNRKFILCTNNENNNGGRLKIATDICYPRIKKIIKGYKNLKGKKIKALKSNLKYYKTSFVSKSRVSDDTKYGLVQRSTEMICIKEDTFDEVLNKKYIKIFRNKNQYTAILFHLDYFDDFKKELRRLNKLIHIYVFSLTNDTYENDFKDLKQKFDLCPIPESILEVYRKIFKE